MKWQSPKAFVDRFRRSAMWYGALGTVVKVGANLFLIPLVVIQLSPGELALWWVFLALGALVNLADFGFGHSISRVFSFLWAGADDFDAEGLRPPPTESGKPNIARIHQLGATVRYLYWRVAAGATLLMAAGGTAVLYSQLTALPHPLVGWLSWFGYVLSSGLLLANSHWSIACQGINRVRELQASYFWSGLAYLVSAAALLIAGWGLAAMVVAVLLRAWVIRWYCRRAFLQALPAAPDRRAKPDPEMLKRLWPNASKLGVLSLGAYLIMNGNVLISNWLLGNQVTASFGLTAQIGTFMMNFAGLWLSVKWPQVAMLRSQGQLEAMAALFARRLTLTLATFAAMSLVLVLCGNRLLEWKGTHTRLLPTGMLVFYLAYLGQQLFYVQFASLTYTENVIPFFRIGLLTGIGMVVLSLAMTDEFRLWGMLVAPLLAESACSSWYMVRRGFQGQPLPLRRFLREAMFRTP